MINSRNPNFYAAVYAIIKDKDGKVLFQKRANTGFRDGEYQIPAGHIEGKESIKQSLVREVKEELGIDVLEKDLEIEHIGHRISIEDRVYFDVYFSVKNYSGELKNAEPDKCSEIVFVNIDNIQEKELFGYDLDVLRMIESGEKFSSI